MRVGLRWPHGPFQVICVSAAVLLAAASSLQSGFAGHASISTDNRHSSNVNGWSKAGMMAIASGGLNSTNLKNRKICPRCSAGIKSQSAAIRMAMTNLFRSVRRL